MIRLLVLLLSLSAGIAQADVLYLSPVIGDGSDENPFRAHRAPGAWSDCSLLGDRFVCMGPEVPNELGVVGLPTSKEARLSRAEKEALATTLGRVTRETVEEVIWDQADAVKLPLSRQKDGTQRIVVHGVELASRPAPLASYLPDVLHALDVAFHMPLMLVDRFMSTSVALAATFTETFSAGTNNLNGCLALGCTVEWDEFNGTGATIDANEVLFSTNNSTQEARADSAMGTVDHEATATIVSFSLGTATLGSCGVLVRKDNTTTRTFYTGLAQMETTGDLDYHISQRRAAGTAFELARSQTDYAAGETLGLRVVGDQVTLYRNGSILAGPTTDANLSVNTYTGIRSATVGGTATCRVDNHIAADVTTGRNRGALWFN